MIQIRRGTFETNSSSSHSLVVTKGTNEHYTPEEAWLEVRWDMRNEDGSWYRETATIWAPRGNMYFGRHPFYILMSFEEKLRYAYACAPYRQRSDPNKKDRVRYYKDYASVTKKINKFLPQFKKVDFSYQRRNDGIGTDDSCLKGWLKELNIDLIEFLTNKNIVVICDGDEYCIWENMKEIKLVDTNNFEKEL